MGFRFVQNTMVLDSLINVPRLKALILIFGLPICLGIGVFLAVEQYLFAFGLFAIFSTLAIFLFPYVGLLLFLGLTYMRPQDYVPGLMGKPIILVPMILTLGSCLVRILVLRQQAFVKTPQTPFFLFLLSVAVLSSAQVWLVYAKDSFIFFSKILLAYFLIVNLTDTHKKFSLALWFMFAGTIYIAVLGIFQHYGIAPEIAGTTPEVHRGRIIGHGIFDNPNYLAYGVAFMIPFAVYACYYLRFWLGKLFSLSVVFVSLCCIYFTQSRGGLLCAALTIPFCVFQDKKVKTSLIGALIAISIVSVLLKTVPRFGTVATYQDDESAMGRVEAWYAGLNMLRSSPLFGIGYKQFAENWVRASHNAFVEVGSELGLLGLFFWIGLLYWTYKYLKVAVQSSVGVEERWQRVYVKSLKASLLAFAIGFCFASLAYHMLLYLLHSLAVVAGRLYVPEEKRKEIDRIGSRDLLTIGGIETLVVCVWYVFPKL